MSKEKEVEDALIVLYKCSLKDKEHTTQKEQYKIVREYILQQQKEIEILKLTNNYLDIANKDYISKDKIREIFHKYEKLDCITTYDFSNFADDIKQLLDE